MTADQPDISVVIPTYNRADLIGLTLDSILAQTLPPKEVIVVDDGSTDDTEAVLARYGARVRHIKVPNGGDLVARNVGLRAAATEFVAFCDSDDLWQPEFLASIAALWEREPGLTAAYGNFRIVRDGVWEAAGKFDAAPAGFWDGARTVGPELLVFDQPTVERLLDFQPFFPSAMMVNRARFLAIGGYDESTSRMIGCDFSTALRVAEGPLGILKTPLVGIRKHGANISGDVQKMNLGDAKILGMMLEARPALAPHRAAVERSMADRRAAAADTAFDRRDFDAVRAIQVMLPPSHRTLKRRVKAWVSGLPKPLANAVVGVLS